MQKIKSTKELESFLNSEFGNIRRSGKTVLAKSKYFKEIGSTTCEDISYEDQIKVKEIALRNILGEFLEGTDFKVEKSPKEFEYRFKMEFVCAYNPIHEPHSRFGQRKKGNFSWVIDMDESNLVEKEWFDKTRKVYEKLQELGIRNYDLKKVDGELKYIALRAYKDQGLLTIITRTEVKKDLINEAANYALSLGFKGVYWLKNESVSDVANGEVIEIFGQDSIEIPLKVNGTEHFFKVNAFTFFQNNILGFEKMLEYINEYLKLDSKISSKESVLYDFFCGTGVIGQALSSTAEKVIGYDIIKENIEAAIQNANENKLENVEYHVLDLYKEDPKSVVENVNSIAIVDPPRTGLGEKMCEILNKSDVNKLIYISCNPITQAEDLERLKNSYKVAQARGFDMFPQTNHIENIIILERLRS